MRWRFGVPLLLLAASLSACGSTAPALLGEVSGVFLLQRATSRVWLPATPRAAVYAGDRLRTGIGDIAELQLHDGSILRLAPETVLTIAKAPRDRDVTVTHTSGAFQLDARLPLAIKTPLITAGIRGTSLRVEVLDGQHSRLATDEGLVQVSMGGAKVNVARGEEVDAKYGAPLTVQPQQLRPPRLNTPKAAPGGLQLTGITDPGQRVEILIDGTAATHLKADVAGQFVAPTSLSAGTHEIRAVRLGPDDTRSDPSEPLVVYVQPEAAAPVPVFVSILSLTLVPDANGVWIIRGKTNPEAAVRLNDQDVDVAADGGFVSRVVLPAGVTHIAITVQERGQSLRSEVALSP